MEVRAPQRSVDAAPCGSSCHTLPVGHAHERRDVCRSTWNSDLPLEIVIQSLILRALSMAFPVASISSRRLSRALFTTRFTSSSLSSSSESRRKRDFGFSPLCITPSSSDSSSSSDSEEEEEESEALAVRRNRDIAGLAGVAGLVGDASSSELRRDSSESDDSESESAACLKNRDMMVRKKQWQCGRYTT